MKLIGQLILWGFFASKDVIFAELRLLVGRGEKFLVEVYSALQTFTKVLRVVSLIPFLFLYIAYQWKSVWWLGFGCVMCMLLAHWFITKWLPAITAIFAVIDTKIKASVNLQHRFGGIQLSAQTPESFIGVEYLKLVAGFTGLSYLFMQFYLAYISQTPNHLPHLIKQMDYYPVFIACVLLALTGYLFDKPVLKKLGKICLVIVGLWAGFTYAEEFKKLIPRGASGTHTLFEELAAGYSKTFTITYNSNPQKNHVQTDISDYGWFTVCTDRVDCLQHLYDLSAPEEDTPSTVNKEKRWKRLPLNCGTIGQNTNPDSMWIIRVKPIPSCQVTLRATITKL